MPNDDYEIEELLRSMYSFGHDSQWNLSPDDLRASAHRFRLRMPDPKFLVLAAAAVVLIIVGFGLTGFSETRSSSVKKPARTTTTAPKVHSVIVPNLIGQSQLSATNAVDTVGLKVGTVNSLPSSQYGAGIVINQSPGPHESVSPNTSIDLVISSGSASPRSATAPSPTTTTTTTPPSTAFTPPSTTVVNALTRFIGSWGMHDGLIVINSNGTGQLRWPGITAPIGILQVAQIAVTATSLSQAQVSIISGTLSYSSGTTAGTFLPDMHTFGPGSTFTLSTTPFGLALTENSQHVYDFCTWAELHAGLDQQYCGA